MLEFAQYYEELVSVALIATFMAISPGADFAMVTRNSIFHSRTAGLCSALGVSLAIWIHVAYSIAGLAVIISNSIVLFSILKYAGAVYLIYTGWQTFRSTPETEAEDYEDIHALSKLSAVKTGFITNALNPKTTIFFMSIFTQVVDQQTPIPIQIMYGAIISIAHLAWFGTVSIVLTQPPLLRSFNQYRKRIEKVIGSVLVGFGLKIAATSNN